MEFVSFILGDPGHFLGFFLILALAFGFIYKFTEQLAEVVRRLK